MATDGTSAPSEHRPLLEVADLHVHFHTANGTVKAVDGVSLSIDPGEVLALVGQSGCGKTTFALSLLRLLPQPSGRIVGGQVRLDGRNLLTLSEGEMRRVRGAQIAMVFQDPFATLNPVLPIAHQVGEALQLHQGLDRSSARRRALELLELVEIPGARSRLDAYPHELSGGMRQRVMLAIALSCTPRLLVADEPTASLDVTIQSQILRLLSRVRSELHMAMLLITHDFGIVAGIADRVAVMEAGALVETGPVEEIFHAPRHPYTRSLLRAVPVVRM